MEVQDIIKGLRNFLDEKSMEGVDDIIASEVYFRTKERVLFQVDGELGRGQVFELSTPYQILAVDATRTLDQL